MKQKTIIVPVDGASNIKLEVFDYDSLECLRSSSADTPVRTIGGLHYNALGEEFAWFEETIRALPPELRDAAVIAPVARGASGGLIGRDNTLFEEPGAEVALAYTHRFPERVEERFREMAGSAEEFFRETGSILDLPGSLTLVKRLLFEEMERPDLLERAGGFAPNGILISGRFLGDYLEAWRVSGNEHSTWMCHTGARNIRMTPGTPSGVAEKISAFGQLIPAEPSVAYRAIGVVPSGRSDALGLPGNVTVVPGGHDTCLSHIPIMSTFSQSFPEHRGKPVVQVEAGSWTMVARIGGAADLPPDGYRRDIIVQGTVDGEPVVTARYGGGYDFRYMRELAESGGEEFAKGADDHLLAHLADAADAFVLPNINPSNHGTGPFPELRGRITGGDFLFGNPGAAYLASTIATALTASVQVEAISGDRNIPLVITAGAAKDRYYRRLLATFTGCPVYALVDRQGNPVTETTSLGAALAGKAACLGIHPYAVDASGLGVAYRAVEPYRGALADSLDRYREKWREEIDR